MPKRSRTDSYASRKRSRFTPRRRKTKYAAKGRGRIAKICRQVIMKKAEPKQKSYDHGKTELYHNVFANFSLNGSSTIPLVGDTQQQRDGDQINCGGYLIRMLLGQKADRPNVTYRYMIAKTQKGEVYDYNAWFSNKMNNILLDSPDKDHIKVLKSGTFKPHMVAMSNVGGGLGREFTVPFKLWLPYKKLLKLSGTTVMNDGDLHLIIGAFDAFGSLITDNIAYTDFTQTMYYKDP